ncbi:DUF2161 family putative PD-(D/E)XK-type phosphodiesterase [Tyzzerella sp. OttesenSCG-928-J15]|nr:DUF2161 family putative PD-(D/E)XK-type phosphodiesterase [Tyzzerella sp. OttesenSCG-928-J15]
MLIKNFYGWFDRVDKGTYALSNSVAYEMEDGKWRSLFQLYLEKYKDFPQADEEN